MKNNSANFKVDTRLASILGESYRSSEYALKELVDNAWDADAENVEITFPKSLTQDPIIIKDDGSGMTEKEIRLEYLFIANSRTSRKGERTPFKKRRVKGKKGIGKFAGLTVGRLMEISTFARGLNTKLVIDKNELLRSRKDLEKVDLPLETEICDNEIKGTIITIKHLHESLHLPNPERLSEILVSEYGRENDINILLNGQQIGVSNIKGDTIYRDINIPGVGSVKLKCTITEKPTKNSGVAIRVGGKIIGKPTKFGIDENENIPNKLTKRIYAEIEADSLLPDVTADHGAIIDNSIAYQKVQEYCRPILEEKLIDCFANEIALQKARNQKKLNSELSKLPEYKRRFAEKSLDKVLKKFYTEDDEKFDTIISVLIDAIEKDHYYEVIQEIDNAKDRDVSIFAEALSQFGLAEISFLTQQANNRLKFLDFINKLANDQYALEKDMHKALENNLWVFGDEYSLMSSNLTLKNILDKLHTIQKESSKSKDRPDLLLSQNHRDEYLLIEFKKPSITIGRDDENQAVKYRDEIKFHLGNIVINIFIIGGKIDSKYDFQNSSSNTKLITFHKLISDAKSRVEWLLQSMKNEK